MEALRVDKNLAEVYNNRGELWLRRKDYGRAINDFREALRLKSDYAAARINLNRALEEKAQHRM